MNLSCERMWYGALRKALIFIEKEHTDVKSRQEEEDKYEIIVDSGSWGAWSSCSRNC